jgi:hypothetical protein
VKKKLANSVFGTAVAVHHASIEGIDGFAQNLHDRYHF